MKNSQALKNQRDKNSANKDPQEEEGWSPAGLQCGWVELEKEGEVRLQRYGNDLVLNIPEMPSTVLGALSHSIATTNLWLMYYYFSHFIASEGLNHLAKTTQVRRSLAGIQTRVCLTLAPSLILTIPNRDGTLPRTLRSCLLADAVPIVFSSLCISGTLPFTVRSAQGGREQGRNETIERKSFSRKSY